MKSFNDWLDDNVASTREKLAKQTPQSAPAPADIGSAGATRPVNQLSPAGWVDDLTSKGSARLAYLHKRLAGLPPVAGRFPVGAYIRLCDPLVASATRAEAGAMARVIGYGPKMAGGAVVVVEWSDDEKRSFRSNKVAGDGSGAEHGYYYDGGFEAA